MIIQIFHWSELCNR